VGVVIEEPKGLDIIIVPIVVYSAVVVSRDDQRRAVGGVARFRVTSILAYFRRRPVVALLGDGVDHPVNTFVIVDGSRDRARQSSLLALTSAWHVSPSLRGRRRLIRRPSSRDRYERGGVFARRSS
jgi:hypothetical protein